MKARPSQNAGHLSPGVCSSAKKELSELGDEWFAHANTVASSFPGDAAKQ
jgi:hypothetical protein